ncbi:hypothetical protein AB0F92_40095 [Kitasatospora aureofaciens]|uniref:hypothetical protein n=1 Tax=Kitasatospora aureofaciens TaxID=1894 RepID=UPI0033C76269
MGLRIEPGYAVPWLFTRPDGSVEKGTLWITTLETLPRGGEFVAGGTFCYNGNYSLQTKPEDGTLVCIAVKGDHRLRPVHTHQNLGGDAFNVANVDANAEGDAAELPRSSTRP